jgi:hypothetical protein
MSKAAAAPTTSAALFVLPFPILLPATSVLRLQHAHRDVKEHGTQQDWTKTWMSWQVGPHHVTSQPIKVVHSFQACKVFGALRL